MSRVVTARQRRLLALPILGALVTFAYVQLTAHSIDYVGMNLNPTSSMNGGSGNWTVTNAVNGGAAITFDLKYQIATQGATTSYPRTVDFQAVTDVKPAGAPDAVVTGLASHTFTSSASNFTDTVTIIAPSTPGAYTVSVKATSATTGGPAGLTAGNGIKINFTVAEANPSCETAATELTVGSVCVLLHQQAAVALTATLTTTGGNTPVAGETVEFFIDGTSMGTAVTDADGVATLENVDVSAYSVGDHDIVATYAGQDCAYGPTNGTANLGVQYMFLGFQQPINADGSSAFGGRTVPVKIRLADANGAPVTDAIAHVFFAFGTPAVVGTEAEPVAMTNSDTGNRMRYDAGADQYIFNWDIAGLQNGTYTVRVDLGEGECGDSHTVVLSLKKKGSK